MRLVIPPLSDRRLQEAELQAALDAVDDHINNPDIRTDHLQARSVGFRQLKHASIRTLMARSTNLGTSGPFGGWYELPGLRLDAPSSVSYALNQDGSHAPLHLFSAKLFFSDWINTLPAGRFRLGYTTDSGATWTTLPATERPVGRGSGETQRYFDAGQLHYYTQAAGYLPFNQPTDGCVFLLAGFGGPNSMADPLTISHYGVFINNATLGDGLDHGVSRLRMREPTG